MSSWHASPIDWSDHGMPNRKSETTTVVLLRHGETIWNAESRYQGQLNSSLTPLGREQATTVAKRLRRMMRFDLVVTSDLGRAVETANIVVKQLRGRPPLLKDPSCRERNYGVWEGRTREEAKAVCDNGKDLDDKYSLDIAPDGGETHAALQLRAQNFMLQLVRQHRGSAVLVVTHGAFMQEAVKCLAGVTGQVKGRRAALKMSNACICKLTLGKDDAEWNLHCVGDTGHFEDYSVGVGCWAWMLTGVLIGVGLSWLCMTFL